MNMIQCKDIAIRQGAFSLDGISFTIETGEYACLVGPTGVGKTTIMEAVCGLKKIPAGKVILNDRDITLLRPGERNIGFVPQDGALFETMTVAENISFPLMIRKWPSGERKSRVKELANLLSIEHLLNRRPGHLSGGEKQRVALGRALSFRPQIICMDEPLSALDDKTKMDIIMLIRELKEKVNITALHISHNLKEVEMLADKILHLKDKKLVNYEAKDFFVIKDQLL